MLRVNEIFVTIQGEARYTGTPSVFVRLQGCPVGCPWCDTKHTWPAENLKAVIPMWEMVLKEKDAPTYAEVSVEDLVDYCTSLGPDHVVITGGEPFAQDLRELTARLSEHVSVQVETSGTHEINCSDEVWVTLSPKIDMPGGLQVLSSSVARANEIKMPVEDESDLENLRRFLMNENAPSAPVWLQPVSMDPRSTQLCVDACLKEGFNLSIQTHKVANIR